MNGFKRKFRAEAVLYNGLFCSRRWMGSNVRLRITPRGVVWIGFECMVRVNTEKGGKKTENVVTFVVRPIKYEVFLLLLFFQENRLYWSLSLSYTSLYLWLCLSTISFSSPHPSAYFILASNLLVCVTVYFRDCLIFFYFCFLYIHSFKGIPKILFLHITD